jgi:LmbE family N-acetylglucosaminyl deacetylase
MTRTIVCFHAHPDDEVLLMGGSMARLAREGHRVVLVTATGGGRGLAARSGVRSTGRDIDEDSLAGLRERELAESARILGCARVVVLGYRDSGSDSEAAASAAEGASFATTPVDEAARRLADLLDEESADALTIYDPAGGYGHPDHIHVNRVGRRAAELAGTALVLEVTVDRRLLRRALMLIRPFRPASADFDPHRFDNLFTDPRRITHRVDVKRYLPQKRAAMKAHTSQATADEGDRTLAWILRLPAPLFALAFGHEWFVEHGRATGRARLDDLLVSLAEPSEERQRAANPSSR